MTALRFPPAYYDELAAAYAEKREIFLAGLDAAGLVYTPPQGAYYVLVDISGFIDGTDWDDARFAEWLARRVGVAAVPGSSFFREPVRHLIRFHFAKKPETLRAAGERLLRVDELWRQDRG